MCCYVPISIHDIKFLPVKNCYQKKNFSANVLLITRIVSPAHFLFV